MRMQHKTVLALFLIGAAMPGAPVFAGESLKVAEARVIATVPGQTVAAAYMTLSSPEDARVVAAESEAAESVQFHAMSVQGGVMRMRRLEALDLPARRVVRLAPGGTHLMLAGLLRSPLRAGDTVTLRLRVSYAAGTSRTVSLSLPVVDIRDATAHDLGRPLQP